MDIYRPISYKHGLVLNTTKLHSLIPVWMTLTIILGHSNIKNQNLCAHFVTSFSMNLYEIGMLPYVGLFKFMLNLYAWSVLNGKNSTSVILESICLRFGWHLEAYELVCFKLSKILDMTKLYI